MGLFSSEDDDSVDESVQELIENAHHDSVNEERLTKLKPGRLSRYLHDKPLIDYLNEQEQPNFILAARNKPPAASGSSPPSMPERSGTGMTMYMVTDERWLTVTSNENGDQTLEILFEDIDGLDYELGGTGSHEIVVELSGSMIKFPIANIYADEDVEAVCEYLFDTSPATKGESIEIEDESSEVSANDEDGSESSSEDTDRYSEQVQNATGNIDSKDIEAIEEHLDSDEQIHYILKGASISIEGGNSEDRKGSLTGTVRSAVTDTRVLTVVPQKIMGEDTKSLPYDDMGGVDFNKGLANKYLKIQSHGRTYKIHTTDTENTKSAKDYVRKRKKEVKSENKAPTGSEPDPTEQLKNIKELHDSGVLSDEEFEEKKSDLLDKI